MTAAGPIRVLVVDDDPSIRRFLSTGLEAFGYDVACAEDGAAALRLATTRKPDILILDLGLPDRDGREVIRALRAWSRLPILVLSVRTDEGEKIGALDDGADDYVEKPFGMGELMARLRAALRRRAVEEAGEPVFRLGGLAVDLTARTVSLNADPVRLTPKEYDLLRLFIRHAGRILTHRQILAEIWPNAAVDDVQNLRVLVGQLRRKIEPVPNSPRYIIAEPGIGYRLETGADA
jgi:two-component system KDP operon response regulator KdpE